VKEIKNCILFSTADWDAPYWTNKQHTTKHLALRDIRTLYVESVGLRAPKLNSGIDLARIWRRLIRGLRGVRQVEKNIWVISPLVIPFKHQWKIVQSINRWVLNRTITNFCKKENFLNKATVIWTYHPYVLDYLDCGQYGSLVYHCVDDLSAIPGIDGDSFIAKEKDLLREAKVVFTTSQKLFEKCSAINQNTHDFPNVVDWEHFSRAFTSGKDPDDLENIPHPRLGYFGVLSDFKIDLKLLIELALKKSDWSIVLIGAEREGQYSPWLKKLKELENVHFLGYKKYEELPNYMRGLDAGLLPSLINSYTDSMYPMKLFEYISSGLPIISTPLRFLEGKPLSFVTIASTIEEFIFATERSLGNEKLNIERARSIIGDNTWEARLEKMIAIITKTN
jgi:glycosyltransferase involved in cell wall biosynthesis